MNRIMRTTGIALVCAAFGALCSVSAQTQVVGSSGASAEKIVRPSPLSLVVRPGVDLPIGSTAQYFSLGGTVDVALHYKLGKLLGLPAFAAGGISYAYAPDQASDSISIATARVGAGLQFPLSPRFRFLAYGSGGYYFGTLNDFSLSSTNPYADGGIGMEFSMTPTVSLGITGVYRNYFGLYQGVSAALGTTIALGPQPQGAAAGFYPSGTITPLSGALSETKLDVPPLFPVFYQYYDDHPVGTVDIRNTADSTANDITATVYIKQFMDNPKTVSLKGSLVPGADEQVDLYALFNDNVLSVTEGTKVSAQITFDCTVDGQKYEDKSVETIQFLNRNAMTWDDNRRAAAFVTAKDPQVLSFAKNVVGPIRDREVHALNAQLQTAMGIHDALDLYGLNYVPDPTTPYVVFSKKQGVPDFLQFPRQTLQYKSGDCDDLSILYSALLESVGVNAAFITTPGHIFVAVDTGLAPDQAQNALIPDGQFIVKNNEVWIPVEITLRHKGFLAAWQTGAKEWNEADQAGNAGFYPIEKAWSVYAPVGLPGSGPNLVFPATGQVVASYQADVRKFIDQAISPEVTRLRAQIASSGSLSAMNHLGILYAKYGQPDQAEAQFKQILQKRSDYVPAVINLGNVYFLQQDWQNARKYYQQASELQPDNGRVVLAVARVNQELENYGDAKRNYEKLKKIDPPLAKKYSYLAMGAAGANRAADVTAEQQQVEWEAE